jgi:hypothetical protein
MSKITELASGRITASDTITIERVEADETPAVVLIRWPVRPSIIHPRRFPDTAATGRATVCPGPRCARVPESARPVGHVHSHGIFT